MNHKPSSKKDHMSDFVSIGISCLVCGLSGLAFRGSYTQKGRMILIAVAAAGLLFLVGMAVRNRFRRG